MRLWLVGACIACAIGSFFGTLKVLDRFDAPSRTASVRSDPAPRARPGMPPNRCEVILTPSTCLDKPQAVQPDPTGFLLDDFEGAATNEKRCLARAQDFHNFCKLTGFAVARFWRDARFVAEKRSGP